MLSEDAGVREGCCGQGSTFFLLSKAIRVVGSSLEVVQTQPLSTLPSQTIVLALSNGRMSEMMVHFLDWTSKNDLRGLCHP